MKAINNSADNTCKEIFIEELTEEEMAAVCGGAKFNVYRTGTNGGFTSGISYEGEPSDYVGFVSKLPLTDDIALQNPGSTLNVTLD